MENGRIMATRMKIIVFAAIVIPAVLVTMPRQGSAEPKSATDTLLVTAEVANVCDVLTTSRARGFDSFGERLGFWRISIACTLGENFLVSLQDISNPPSEESGPVSTELYLASGLGTGEWEPLFEFGNLLSRSGNDSKIFQLTLIY